LVFWRTFAVVAVLAAILVALHHNGIGLVGEHVAKLSVSGVITDDEQLNDAVEKLADDDSVKALIVSIDSPGGSVAGGESLHDAIAHVAEKKPVVAVMGGVAASAGYMVAVPADRIFARAATLTGSIGVLLEAPDFSGLLGKLGIDAEALVSGPLKNQPSFTHPLSPEGRQVLQGLVMSMYNQFVAMVAAGRHMDPDKVRQLGDGRAYTGAQALRLGLVDQIGGEHAARAWLASAKGVAASLPVEDVTAEGFAFRAFAGSFAPIVDSFWKTVISQSVSLDGGWAIWQRFGG
jgi:protease IV